MNTDQLIKLITLLSQKENSSKEGAKHLADKYIGEKVLLRCDRSGVFYGVLKAINGTEAEVDSCRRIHYWENRFTLTDVALRGLNDENKTRVSRLIDGHILNDVIEIIPCREESIRSIDNFKSHEVD